MVHHRCKSLDLTVTLRQIYSRHPANASSDRCIWIGAWREEALTYSDGHNAAGAYECAIFAATLETIG